MNPEVHLSGRVTELEREVYATLYWLGVSTRKEIVAHTKNPFAPAALDNLVGRGIVKKFDGTTTTEAMYDTSDPNLSPKHLVVQ